MSWKNNSHKALLVTGARQIGKSYAIRAFGKSNYASYYEVNLLLDAEARDVLVGAKNSIDFINRVALLADAPLVEGDTLIFVDEIQEYPQIVTLMKALVEDGRFSYVFSGSMLGTEFKDLFFPVGMSSTLLCGQWILKSFVGQTASARMCLQTSAAALSRGVRRKFYS
ncbi:MAG: AAA family ATPase [Collinsella sp.]